MNGALRAEMKENEKSINSPNLYATCRHVQLLRQVVSLLRAWERRARVHFIQDLQLVGVGAFALLLDDGVLGMFVHVVIDGRGQGRRAAGVRHVRDVSGGNMSVGGPMASLTLHAISSIWVVVSLMSCRPGMMVRDGCGSGASGGTRSCVGSVLKCLVLRVSRAIAGLWRTNVAM